MTARSALHTAGGVTDASDARLSLAASFAKFGISPRTGVLYAGNQSLLTATATMVVNVAPLHAVGSKADGQGVYVVPNDGVYPLTIATPPGSGSRTDKVYIMQQDSSPGTTSPDATTAPLIAATSGVLPAGAVYVGSVVVPAGITKLTDPGVVVTTGCQWTAAAGAPIPVRSQTERDALPAYVGAQAMRLDLGARVETYDGTGWRLPGPYATASGGGNIGTSVAVDAISGPFPQSFPAGRFTVPPNLTFGTTDARCTVQGTSITKDGFNLWVRNNSASTAPGGQVVSWSAVQMTPTSASE